MTRPCRKSAPQHGHLFRSEAIAGKHAVGHPVQLPASVGEIAFLKTRVKLPGEAD